VRFALLIAVVGFAAGVRGGIARDDAWTRVSERAVWVLFGFVSFAMLALFNAFVNHDYQLAYVASHSARSMDTGYRLAALWGGQAGSLLLWLWMLCAYGAACVWFNRRQNRGLMPWVVAVVLGNAIFFLVLVVAITDPFEKLPPGHVMSDGSGLNPLLQHPAMMIHPLMLYTGLVGFVVPFAFAFAALLSGELGRHSCPGSSEPPGSVRRGAGRSSRGSSSRSAYCSAGAGPTRCWAGGATGPGIRWRTRPSCRGSPPRPFSTR
jgi:cytochrome c-type biogenesis protein CcmF